MGRLKIKKTLFFMHDKDRNDRLKFKTNLLQKMLMTTLPYEFIIGGSKVMGHFDLVWQNGFQASLQTTSDMHKSWAYICMLYKHLLLLYLFVLVI
jgi:hypothetical protein